MFLAVSGLSPCLLHKPMCSALQKKATFPQMLDILQTFVDPVVVQCVPEPQTNTFKYI